jgi:predicted ATPase
MTGKGRALRFTLLELQNWRNFSSVEVGLRERAFLVGPNASGKSNLLDAFRFLHDIVAVGGGFRDAVSRRGGVSKLRSLAARAQRGPAIDYLAWDDTDDGASKLERSIVAQGRQPLVGLRVTIGDDENPEAWEYEIRFTQDNLRRPVLKYERVARNGQGLLVRTPESEKEDPERLTQTSLEQVNVNREFREIAEFFASVRYLHVVPQLIREPDRSVGRQNDPYGGDFLEQIARSPKSTREARLRRILDALHAAVPQLEDLQLWRDEVGTPHLRGKYKHWRPHGAWQTEEDFSDGTLRLIGLLWAVLEGSGPLLLEEPELSLHSEVVRFLPQLLARVQRQSGRQVAISTHSKDLLEDEGIGLDEVLLLEPSSEGTVVRRADSIEEVKLLLEGGLSMADAVIPRTRPERAEQLARFDL